MASIFRLLLPGFVGVWASGFKGLEFGFKGAGQGGGFNGLVTYSFTSH